MERFRWNVSPRLQTAHLGQRRPTCPPHGRRRSRQGRDALATARFGRRAGPSLRHAIRNLRMARPAAEIYSLNGRAESLKMRGTMRHAMLSLSVLLVHGLLSPVRSVAQSSGRPEPGEWFAGDAHVHRGIGCGRAHEKEMLTPQQLREGMETNNLAVISVLADIGNGEIKYADRDIPLITGKDHPVSMPDRILHWDAEWHYDPQGVTFPKWKKVLGGHLIILGLRQGGTPFAEYTYPIFEWARRQGAIAGFAHMQYLADGIPKELDCCKPLEMPVETALGNVAFLMEDVHGSDTATHAYYRVLNCGFHPALVAATDYSCNFMEPFGTLLTYVRIPDGKLSYRNWVEGIAKGRTVVSRNGHNEFLNLKVNDTASPGDEVHLRGRGTVRVSIRWSTVKNLTGRIELVRNGTVVASREGSASPGSPLTFEATQDFTRSGWLCARRMDEKGHQTHTGAIFIIVNEAPIRASAADAEFFVQWIDHLLEQTSPGGAWSAFLSKDRAAAQSRYRKAKAIFEKIALEAQKTGQPADIR